MRPFNKSIKMENWNIKRLKTVLNNEKTDDKIKKQIRKVIAERKEKNWEMLNKFFDPNQNKFLALALWQLYREGKARVYGVGKHKKFSVDNLITVFDKMVKVKNAYDKYCTRKVNGQI